MPISLMYEEENYVVLEANKPEQFMTAVELLEKLRGIIATQQDNLPRDLQKLSSLDAQAEKLRDTYCEYEFTPGKFIQWYVVRLEK
ncbi:MAG: chlororespiratory reduction protein 7 [Trichodesmium sp. St16_bin4-tuft]|nr:chlororespiratory reduction protein 7 [Trichodesmium sp. MAG_R01]MDE5070079.1 chlororespiratory reduction protein 7 [Trichodesmium sp. St4_bin8_1]MDE5071204.1 chlororespiratory reduction protein 7 [Trichodesmium sp. St5_bin8]MDE5079113.1 chlororespiratory reduction protein 7 [Trichodesmium sp. St2_bin6]MDE5092251.1 chlororespiratory reduction protein 7 [Trichodesmium sp. St18_bin3_1_1]MDE5098001.1 chlororespiratory reduction protein 7 [Trichodesmium sp. St16_bin4-tuft]MDE5102698.1 chlorore